MNFEWDARKAARNLEKHGVAFEDATAVFDDVLARYLGPEDVDGEERWAIIGMSASRRVMVVIFVDAASNIRVISARVATRRERRQYER